MCSYTHTIVSDSLEPYRLWHTRFLCPGNFPGKNPGVGCHSLLQGIFPAQGSNLCLLHLLQMDSLPPCHWEAQCIYIHERKKESEVAQLCTTLCSPMNGSPPFTVHGIFQAGILEWVAIPYSRGSSRSRD